MRQKQRGGKRLPYKRKKGGSVLHAELAGLPGAETLHKPESGQRVFCRSAAPARAARPPVVPVRRPAVPRRPAVRPRARRPGARFHARPAGCPVWRAVRPPRPAAGFSPRLAAAPATWPVCARRGLGAPPRRFCARPGCATRRPPAPHRSAAAAVPARRPPRPQGGDRIFANGF